MHYLKVKIRWSVGILFSEEVHDTNVSIKKKSPEISGLFLYRIKKD